MLTATMLRLGEVLKAFEASGRRGQVKVMIGGGALTQQFAEQIGADGFSPDAAKAADLPKDWAHRKTDSWT